MSVTYADDMKVSNVDLAKEEFFDKILKTFVNRGKCESLHFSPHLFRVISDSEATWLEFEIMPAKEKVTLASWNGKTLSLLPNWATKEKLDHSVWEAIGILTHRVIEEVGDWGQPDIFRIIVEAVVRSVKNVWDDKVSYALAGDFLDKYVAGGGGVSWDHPGDDGVYQSEYPYILDVENMRIERPHILEEFLREEEDVYSLDLFSDILTTLESKFPGSIPHGGDVEGKLLQMRLDWGNE